MSQPTMKNVLIDRSTVPVAAPTEFGSRLKRAHQQLQAQPGLVSYAVDESTADGQLASVTVAVRASEQAIHPTKVAMQAAHHQAGRHQSRLVNGPCTGRYRTSLDQPLHRPCKISRADLADYRVWHLNDGQTFRTTVEIFC